MVFHTEVSAVIKNEQGSKFWDADITVKGHENLELSNGKDLSGHPSGPLPPPQRTIAPLIRKVTSPAEGTGSLAASHGPLPHHNSAEPKRKHFSTQPIWVKNCRSWLICASRKQGIT